MHGLINRSIQCFLRDTYGDDSWQEIAHGAHLDFDSFEAMLGYDDVLTDKVLDAAAVHLEKSRETILEDLGTYLVSHPNVERLRRLLRFGGASFLEFMFSLEDLPGRARLAVPDLDLPSFELRDHFNGAFTLFVTFSFPGAGHVLVGTMRAMADDYGALVFLEHLGANKDVETLSIQLVETAFAEGREFSLADGHGG